jgi:hypothetical protein
MLHDGCPVPGHFSTECPQSYYADMVGRERIEELQQTWQRLEEKARAVGGELILWSTQNRH